MKAPDLAIFAATAALAAAFKQFAAHADADALAFLLEPTARLVELGSGHEFTRESGSGPVSRELSLVIAPSCSGANYAIVAFAGLVLGFVPRFSAVRRKLAFVLAAAALAYAATLCVNAARILLAVAAGGRELFDGAVGRAALHRAEGVAIYLGSLLVLFVVTEKLLFGAARLERRSFLALPLAVYFGITLVVPALNGAWTRPAYFAHAASVVAVGAVLWLGARAALRLFSPAKPAAQA